MLRNIFFKVLVPLHSKYNISKTIHLFIVGTIDTYQYIINEEMLHTKERNREISNYTHTYIYILIITLVIGMK